jgi:hypothetical protein
MEDRPETPAPTSLKYIAWSVKEMNDSMKKIVSLFEQIADSLKSPPRAKEMQQTYKQDQIPF